jgi:hypothetical protein
MSKEVHSAAASLVATKGCSRFAHHAQILRHNTITSLFQTEKGELVCEQVPIFDCFANFFFCVRGLPIWPTHKA